LYGDAVARFMGTTYKHYTYPLQCKGHTQEALSVLVISQLPFQIVSAIPQSFFGFHIATDMYV
jgi:hypothetical protein